MAHPIIATAAASATPADSTSHTCTLPSGITARDLLLAVVVCRGAAAMTWPAGWTALTNGAGASGTAVRSEARYRIAAGNEGASISISGASVAWVSRAWRITGAAGTAPACAAASAASADADPPALGDPAYARTSLWIVHVAWDGRPACSFWPTPFAAGGRLAEHVADSGGASGWVKQLSAGIERDHTRGMDPGPCTSASAAWRALTIIVEPAVTDEAAEAAAKIAQRAADYGVGA
jgi:hypothetical protein